jgi:hypothetical protein
VKSLSTAPLALVLYSLCFVPNPLSVTSPSAGSQDHAAPSTASVWSSTKAEHVDGFPDIKPNKKGTLTLSADSLTFSGKSGRTSIERSSITAVSAGNQRVELWGTGGRLMRMGIPDGGGLAAATFMHHRVDMLTVAFRDARGGDHSAVFFLPAKEADVALQSFAVSNVASREASAAVCQAGLIEPKSVLVSVPDWKGAEVPAAYQSLVYEHVIERLRRTKDVGDVYRDGEVNGETACPQYVIHTSIVSFKQGSSVQRAFLGPIGMFVGTTQMRFDVKFTEASGKVDASEPISATIRGDSESTGVADLVAKKIAKHYAALLKNAGKSNSAKARGAE